MPYTKITAIFVIAGFLTACAGGATKPPAAEPPAEKPPAAPVVEVVPAARQEYDSAIKAMQSGDVVNAKQILAKMTQTYPDLSGPYVNLGIIYFRADEIDKAEESFKKALQVNPKSAVSLNHLGIIYRGKGDFKDAKTSYEKALQIDPDYAYAHLNYGILLELYFSEFQEALNHYKRFQELKSDEDKEVKNWIVDLERRINTAKK